ncbi:MAG: hypothetical protein BZY75_00830 [SAR202 cluster bacterium Io17-Chloro-G7]|nr:MAG: hypothetical protein BZY75_00830 [SAR202 cluster bacterium Io17-Chloro-G7]
MLMLPLTAGAKPTVTAPGVDGEDSVEGDSVDEHAINAASPTTIANTIIGLRRINERNIRTFILAAFT